MLVLAHVPRNCVSVCTGTCDCIWTCDCDWTCDYVCHVTGLVIVTVLAPALVLLVIVPSLVLEPVIVLALAHPVSPWCKQASTFVIHNPTRADTDRNT